MKKKILCTVVAVMMLLFTCIAGGCGGGKSDSGEVPEGAATQNTQTFVNTVTQIKNEEVTLASGARIEVALTVYDLLNDSEKKNTEVIEYKTLLDGYKSKYDLIKAAAEREEQERLQAQLAAEFQEEVEKLPNIGRLTLDDKSFVEHIRELYEKIGETNKNGSGVIAAYETLLQAEAKIDELEEAAHAEEVRLAAEEFIDAVNEIDEEEEITLELGSVLENLLYDYEEFTDEIKEYEGVAEAKEKLDGYYAQYAVLRDERDVKEFIRLANALSPVSSITLGSERAILDAENAYKEMSDAARAAEGVDEANEIVKAARARYDELFAEAEEKRIEAFIAAANEVGTDIENVNIKWYDVLHKASEAYSALTYKSQLRSDVKAAFDRWNQAQKAFDRKGYQQIPMKEPSIHYSGDNPPHLIMGTGMFDDVMAFYRVTSLDQLGQHAIMWLNIYQNDEVIARGEINMASDFFNNGSYLLMNYNIQRIIKSIAADNPKLVSGGTYAFSVNFEDKKGEFIPSLQSKVSAGHVYIW